MAGFSQGGGVGLCARRTGWSTAIRAPTSGAWMSRVTATGDARLHEREGARELLAPLPDPLPERGAAGRVPLRTTPVYERLQAENAVFGDYCGLEHALWFAPKGTAPTERSPSAAPTRMRTRSASRLPCGARRGRAPRDLATTASSRSGPRPPSGSAVMANKVPRGRRACCLTPMLYARPPDRRLHRGAPGAAIASSWSARMPPKCSTCVWFERTLPPAGVTILAPARWNTQACRLPVPPRATSCSLLDVRGPVDLGVPVHVVPQRSTSA
jgi:dimethylglycine dehydrogenase